MPSSTTSIVFPFVGTHLEVIVGDGVRYTGRLANIDSVQRELVLIDVKHHGSEERQVGDFEAVAARGDLSERLKIPEKSIARLRVLEEGECVAELLRVGPPTAADNDDGAGRASPAATKRRRLTSVERGAGVAGDGSGGGERPVKNEPSVGSPPQQCPTSSELSGLASTSTCTNAMHLGPALQKSGLDFAHLVRSIEIINKAQIVPASSVAPLASAVQHPPPSIPLRFPFPPPPLPASRHSCSEAPLIHSSGERPFLHPLYFIAQLWTTGDQSDSYAVGVLTNVADCPRAPTYMRLSSQTALTEVWRVTYWHWRQGHELDESRKLVAYHYRSELDGARAEDFKEFIRVRGGVPWMRDNRMAYEACANPSATTHVKTANGEKLFGRVAEAALRKIGGFCTRLVRVEAEGIRRGYGDWLSAHQFEAGRKKFKGVEVGDLVELSVVKLPAGCILGPTYVLPAGVDYHVNKPPFHPDIDGGGERVAEVSVEGDSYPQTFKLVTKISREDADEVHQIPLPGELGCLMIDESG